MFFDVLRAFRVAIDAVGSATESERFNRFMEIRRAFLDAFPATNPPPAGVPSDLARGLGAIATTLEELTAAVNTVADSIRALNIGDLLGTNEDNRARAVVDDLSTAALLPSLPLPLRAQLCRSLLEGNTDDDDEDAVNLVVRHTWAASLCERYLLVSHVAWEVLEGMDGDQYDTLEALLSSV